MSPAALEAVVHEPRDGYADYMDHRLDKDALKFLELAAKAGLPPLGAGTVAEARAAREARKPAVPPASVGKVEDVELGGVPCRLYSNRKEGDAPEPLILFFHGGGWVLGSLNTHDPFCRLLCNASGCAVISVGYGLAPEHPFPRGLVDCLSATRFAYERAESLGIDRDKIIVSGDSAGGNYAAIVAQNRPCPIKLQLLIYPSVDLTINTERHKSLKANEKGLLLELASMVWFMGHYFSAPGSLARDHPLASPLLAPDSMFAGLPPALVITCGADPLYSEGVAYAEKLVSLGIPVEYHDWPGQLHGFATQQIGHNPGPDELIGVLAAAVKSALS
ncbi:alpha/beta hydrolase fold-3 domain-containing protein [Hyaloraphidium curvatum]|nr:alpha/beta hydrolase fold-3 domain-containing protein [Hyaloraphidium curvatum]